MQNKAARQYAASLAQRYESMKAKGESIYLDVSDFERLIEHYLWDNDNDTASELIDLALSIHPRNEYLLLKRVAWLLQVERAQEAWDLLQQLPQNEDTELMRASVYLALGKQQEALAIFHAQLRSDDKDAALYCSDVAEVLLHYELYKEAKHFVDQGLKLNPKDEELYQQAIEISYLMGDPLACIDYFRRLLDEYPYDAQSWARLGSLYLNLNRLDEAVNALEFANAASSSPMLAACVELGHAYGRLEQYDEAIEAYRQAYDIDEAAPQSLVGRSDLAGCLAECYEHKENYDEALRWYHKALELNEKDDIACVGIAFCHVQKKQAAEAMQYYEKALAINPDNRDIWVGIAELLVSLEQFDAAIAAYHQALKEVEFPSPEVLFALANTHFQIGEYRQALDIFLEMEARDIHLPNLQLCLALCYRLLNDENSSEFHLKTAIAEDANAKQLYEDILKEIQLWKNSL